MSLSSLVRAEVDDRPVLLCTVVSRKIRLCVTPRAHLHFSTHGTTVSQRLATCPSARHLIETAAHLLSSISNQVKILREDHNSRRIATGKTISRIASDYRCILFEFSCQVVSSITHKTRVRFVFYIQFSDIAFDCKSFTV